MKYLPAIRAPKAPVIRSDTNSVELWVCTADGHQYAFTDLDTAIDFRDEWNGDRPPETGEAILRLMSACVLSETWEPRPGCRLIATELPGDLADVLAARCLRVGLNPHRLLSALALTHLAQMTPEKSGSAQVRNLESWEKGRRGFRKWPELLATERREPCFIA